jgi:hypothetical protein
LNTDFFIQEELMLKKQLSLFAALLLVSPLAWSQQTGAVRDNDFSYTYVDVGYEMWEYDVGRGDIEADALFGQGSYALDEHVSVRGGLALYDADYGREDENGNRLSVGLGFNSPLKQGLDLVVTGDIVRDDNDFDTETGLMLAGGVRHQTTAELQLSGGLFYEDIYDDLDELGLQGQALLNLNPQIDVGARLRLSGDLETFGLFGRYNF